MRPLIVVAALPSLAFAGVTTPKAFLGREVCADYRLTGGGL